MLGKADLLLRACFGNRVGFLYREMYSRITSELASLFKGNKDVLEHEIYFKNILGKQKITPT